MRFDFFPFFGRQASGLQENFVSNPDFAYVVQLAGNSQGLEIAWPQAQCIPQRRCEDTDTVAVSSGVRVALAQRGDE